MANAFEFVDTIDYKKFGEMAKHQDTILIGFPAGMPHIPGDETADISDMAEDAKKLTYGTDIIPARPFLEQGIVDGQSEISQAIEAHYKRVVETNNYNGLYRVAATCVAAIQKFVHGDYYKSTIPNAQSTIDQKSQRQKGKYLLSDQPLIDTGQMVNSITSLINGKKAGE